MKDKYITIFAVVALVVAMFVILDDNSDNDAYADRAAERAEATDELHRERHNIITRTVAESSPAVVGVNVTKIRQYRDPFIPSPFYNDPFFQRYFGERSYTQRVESLGSGFIVSPDGYIVTNDHVAGAAVEIVVTLTDGRHLEAKIVGTDPVSDITLLKVDETGLPHLSFGDSDDVIIGEWVVALGNPFGLFEVNEKPTVTVGVVSATDMNLEPVDRRYYIDMIQTDAAINGGNSGGPLVNSVGEVVGMNTIIYTSGNSRGSIGLGFAIPINKVKRVIEELKEKGKIDRNFHTGMAVQNIDDEVMNYFKLESSKGVIVTRIVRDSPAAVAGLEPGDVIVELGGYRVNNQQTLLGVLQEFRVGDDVDLRVVRGDEEIELTMNLERAR